MRTCPERTSRKIYITGSTAAPPAIEAAPAEPAKRKRTLRFRPTTKALNDAWVATMVTGKVASLAQPPKTRSATQFL